MAASLPPVRRKAEPDPGAVAPRAGAGPAEHRFKSPEAARSLVRQREAGGAGSPGRSAALRPREAAHPQER